jgi:hypothetical protein
MTIKKISRSIEAFIDKGADVKSTKDKGFKNVLIRIPNSILEELDELIKKKPWLNRTQWIVEAIHDKIKSEFHENQKNT